MSTKNLENIFTPESIALIGVSERKGSVGYGLFKNLVSGGFEGKIYGVNPKVNDLLEHRIYKSVSEIEGEVDLAIIAVRIEIVPSIISECAEKGIKGAIVISAGGKEMGKIDDKREQEIIVEAGRAGMRIIGPNCLGVVIPHLGINASFTVSVPPKGNIAFISQSGALCTAIMDWAGKEKVGFSHVISIGDMVDVDFGDLIEYLGDDTNVRSILLHIESLTNIKKFIRAARSVSRVKPIIALKAGKLDAGAKSTASPAEALITEDDVYSTIFKRTGIVQVNTIHELFNTAEPLSKQPRPTVPNLAIITNADGMGAMAANVLSGRWGGRLVKFSKKTIKELDNILPPYASKLNPICMVGDVTTDNYSQTLEVCLADEEIGGVIIIFTPQLVTHPSDVARVISEVARKSRTKPIFAVWMGGKSVEEGISILNEAGIPTFGTPEDAVNAFMHMYYYSYNLRLIQETPKLIEGRFEKKRAESVIKNLLEKEKSGTLSEIDSKAIVASYEIPVNRTEVVTTPLEASQVSKELGFPVVLKIRSPDLTHEFNIGGVASDLHSRSEVSKAFKRIISNVKRLKSDTNILGVTVQPMPTEKGFELLLGAKKDPTFGSIILFGAGGAMAEFTKDVAMAIPPLNSTLALRLIEKTRIFDLLSNGFRDIPPADVDTLVKVVVNFSELISAFPEITQVDINPLYIRGDYVVALDARIKVERTKQKSPHHLLITPYPSQYESYHTLKDDTVVLCRPIRPEDEPLILELFNTFSEKTIVYRFFHHIKVTTHERLVRFTQIDYDREIPIIAVCQPPGRERILGILQVIFEPKGEKAEFSLVVGDLWQGRGLGKKLMEIYISIAKERGAKLLWGHILPDNVPMINLSKKMGFNIENRNGVLYAELKLDA